MKQKLSNKNLSPDYQRIPHLDKSISKMTHDDILSDNVVFPLSCYTQEKVDGANMGIAWNDGPILRNRQHILKKGYSKIHTPAKIQFKSAWNWLHKHEDDIKDIENKWGSKVTLYGEWMLFKHSIFYDKLPDLFLIYDIYSSEDEKYISPDTCESLINNTILHFIKPQQVTFTNISQIEIESERKSEYKDGYVEGIVLKTVNGYFIENTYKVVNKYFERTDDFNERKIIKNLTY